MISAITAAKTPATPNPAARKGCPDVNVQATTQARANNPASTRTRERNDFGSSARSKIQTRKNEAAPHKKGTAVRAKLFLRKPKVIEITNVRCGTHKLENLPTQGCMTRLPSSHYFSNQPDVEIQEDLRIDALNSSSSALSSPRLPDQARGKIRPKHYTLRTGQAYVDWVARFVLRHRNNRTGRGRAILAGNKKVFNIGLSRSRQLVHNPHG